MFVLFKKWIRQYKCGKMMTNDGYVKGHNFHQIDWKVYSTYGPAINPHTNETLDFEAPKHWKVTYKCEYCGKIESVHYHN